MSFAGAPADVVEPSASSYTVHITRRRLWSHNDGLDISRKDWWRYVETDPELVRDGRDSARWTGSTAVESPLLSWRDGNIDARNPDQPMIAKMARMAAALEAVAQGDGGETYGLLGDPLPHAAPTAIHRSVAAGSNWLDSVRVPSETTTRIVLFFITTIAAVTLLMFVLISIFGGRR